MQRSAFRSSWSKSHDTDYCGNSFVSEHEHYRTSKPMKWSREMGKGWWEGREKDFREITYPMPSLDRTGGRLWKIRKEKWIALWTVMKLRCPRAIPVLWNMKQLFRLFEFRHTSLVWPMLNIWKTRDRRFEKSSERKTAMKRTKKQRVGRKRQGKNILKKFWFIRHFWAFFLFPLLKFCNRPLTGNIIFSHFLADRL